MKVPTLTSQRTQPANLTSAYSRQSADPAAFGVGFGQAVSQFGAMLAAREEKTNRFGALSALSDFETQAAEMLQLESRNSAPDGSGFASSAEQQFDKAADNFLATKVPPALREEFGYRLSQIKQGVVGKALDFQYKAGDNFFREGISKEYEKARNGLDPRLGGDPSQLAAYKARMQETIAASDLLPQEKLTLWNKIQAGLEGVGYRAAIQGEATAYGGQSSAANLIKRFEGKRFKAYSDKRASTGEHDAWRVGYGSDTVTHPDGSYSRVTRGTVITQEDADRDLARRIPEFQRVAAGQVGKDTWNSLPGNVQAGLTSVTYNYGQLPKSVVAAVKTGDIETIASAVEGLGANKERRKEEAGVIRGTLTPGSDVDENPAFANVPYEDRLALRNDAVRDAIADATAREKQNKAIYSAELNSTLTSIHDGTAGQMEIDAFRQAHPGMAYGDITKLDAALKNYSEGVGLAAATLAKINGGIPLDPTDTDTKKGLNAIVGKEGLAALGTGSQQYVSDSLVPLVTQAGVIPSDVAGLLSGMVRSNNQSKALFALDTLSQLADADPRAYDTGVSDSVQRDVQYWRDRKDLVPQDELMAKLNPGTSMEERQARQQLREDARDYLTKVDPQTKLPTLSGLVSNFVADAGDGGLFGHDAGLGSVPWAAAALGKEYGTLFTDAYERYGNVEEADAAAQEQLKKRWSVTHVGTPTLIRNAPETIYRPFNGSYDYIDTQIRVENKITGDYQIISDDKTDSEAEEYRAGKLDRPPSYRIATVKDGVARLLPGRQWFSVDQDVKDAAAEKFDLRARAATVSRRLGELVSVATTAEFNGGEIDPDDAAELNALREEYVSLKDKLRGVKEKEEREREAGYNAGLLGLEAGRLVGDAPDR